MLPEIFVISLPQSAERRTRITQQMGRLNMPFEFLDAVDGKHLDGTDPRVNWDEVRKYPTWLTRGALGCALSHFAAYDRIERLRLPYAVILEDDCVLSGDVPQILQHLPGHLTGSTVMMMYYSCWNPLQLERSSARSVYGPYVDVAGKCIDSLQTTVAYAITYEAAASLRRSVLPIRVSADSWGYFSANRMVGSVRFVYPMCCDHADGRSTIDYLGRGTVKRNLSLFIDRTKLFPVYQILRLKRHRLKERMHRIQLV